jgi:hypothetical protein
MEEIMSKIINYAKCALYVVCLFLLTACQKNPTEQSIISKNDGTLDISIHETAPNKSEDSVGDPSHTTPDETRHIQYTDTFFSTDGSVEFSLNINQDITDQAYPVLEIAPHMLTSADAENIATALFGQVDFYEVPPTFGKIEDIFSKAELMDSIQRWSAFTNEQSLIELFPSMAGRKDRMNLYLERIKQDIAEFSMLLETMPDNTPHATTKWEFQPEWKYLYPEQDVPKYLQTDPYANQQVCVTTTVDGIPYQLHVTTFNGDEYKLNTIFAYPGTTYSPMSIDRDIFRAQLCRTAEPTTEQIEAVQENAQEMLNRMGIGSWEVNNYSVENTNSDGTPEYVISLTAVPVFEGSSAMHRPQLDNLSENFAASYYLTEALLQFSANGDLIYLRLSSPVDIVEAINKNVATIEIDNLIEKAKKHLTLSDYHAYGLSGEVLVGYQQSAGEDLICKVGLTKFDYGLIRVKVPDSKENYYYLPGIIIYGSVNYCGKNSGTIYVSSEMLGEENIKPLIALNALDGSIIDEVD